MLKPVERRSLSDAVYEQLRDQIVSGEMEIGSKLPSERVLCEMLGVNRGAVREALKRLEQARLVNIQHGGATKVSDFMQTGSLSLLAELLMLPGGRFNTQVVRSIMEMRSALAPDIARLAALRATADQKQALFAYAEQIAQEEELSSLQELSMRFWNTLVEASGNIAYRLAYNSLRNTYERFLEVLEQVLSKELLDADNYQQIAQAIGLRDTQKAHQKARELTQKGEAGLLKVLQALEQMQEEQ